MATVAVFETMLKEVVTAKRLSASKMEKLTEVAMMLMENDTQLVSVLYRTHKSLRASSKISSLYVFDALCRAARNQVVKRNLSGDINSEKGNCATFLLKIDSVLDGLFQDILSSGIPEAKEKTKKVLDIWTKSNTFSPAVLTRLGALGMVIEGSESGAKESSRTPDTSTSTTDPRKQPTPPNGITPPPPASSSTLTAEAAQNALLALLTSAASANNSSNNQIPQNTENIQTFVSPQPHPQSQAQLGQLQLALLQQLSNNGGQPPSVPGMSSQPSTISNLTGFATGASPFSTRLNVSPNNPNLSGPSSASPTNARADTYSNYRARESQFVRSDATENVWTKENVDNRFRGNSLGYRGGFRGRGRGDSRVTNVRDREAPAWDRRNSPYREGGPASNRRRYDSRSRSPPQRRDDRPPYSSTRQDSLKSPLDSSRTIPHGTLQPGKDEFGRDIRADSEESDTTREHAVNKIHTLEEMRNVDAANRHEFQEGHRDNGTQDTFQQPQDPNESTIGLESFDFTIFDPTNPDAWRGLANAFQVSNGYIPSQEELIHLVMATMGMMMGIGVNADFGSSEIPGTVISSNETLSSLSTLETGSISSKDPRSRSQHDQKSDSIVLGRATDDAPIEPAITRTSDVSAADASEDTSGSGGKMQKVGGGWKFVRDGL